MNRYVVNKFLYDTDRNQNLLKRYLDDPVAYVGWWMRERRERLLDNESEVSGVEEVDGETLRALAEYDFVTLYAAGAHPFILWTLMYPVLERTMPDANPVAYYRDRIRPHGRPDFRY